ncbi:MAG TPA: S49 family peptidase [Longimicrobiaceae bacterium]|nr:S49 family peptidase [Longimicrobiaceae bacterium]
MDANRRMPAGALVPRPMLISEVGRRALQQLALREDLTVEALQARRGARLEGTRTARVRDGVAIIPLVGPLFRYDSWDVWWADGTAYETFVADFTAALENPEVHTILVDADTPGGEVNGCAEAASVVYAARGTKPIIGYVGGSATSAGNWVISACDEVVVGPTGMLGCLGAKVVYEDWSAAYAKMGLTEIEVVSEQTPRKNLDPSTEEGRGQVQTMVNAYGEVFLGDLARFYGVDRKTVDADFGRGDVFVGEAAVAAGLARRVSTFEALHAELAATSTQEPAESGILYFFPQQEQHMSQPNAAAGTAAAPAGAQVPEGYVLVRADATADQLAATFGPAVTAIRTVAATAERTRILDIEAAALPGHEALVATLKQDPAVSAGDAALKIVAAERSAGGAALRGLASEEANLQKPGDVPTPPAAAAGTQTGDAQVTTRINATWDALFGKGGKA